MEDISRKTSCLTLTEYPWVDQQTGLRPMWHLLYILCVFVFTYYYCPSNLINSASWLQGFGKDYSFHTSCLKSHKLLVTFAVRQHFIWEIPNLETEVTMTRAISLWPLTFRSCICVSTHTHTDTAYLVFTFWGKFCLRFFRLYLLVCWRSDMSLSWFNVTDLLYGLSFDLSEFF